MLTSASSLRTSKHLLPPPPHCEHLDMTDCCHMTCRVKWLCYEEELGEICWNLHHSLHHMRSDVMYKTAQKECRGSPTIPSNLTRALLKQFAKCCPCSRVMYEPKQRTISQIRSTLPMERVCPNCLRPFEGGSIKRVGQERC